ncbi:AfsR/SARP family transcriptional regulator [Actinoplanes sp. NPDC049599]|uniref:AfsR/SARP family transcriptional regulator n=1 Tax=Actinoplanes sp. NPDC049599 TaxID=3363903 RepID=UPI003787C56C
MAVEFLLLGDVRARIDGQPVELGHARQRGVLLALLIDANRRVPADRLLDRVWGDQLPQRARNALSGYVSRLRRLFAATGAVTITRDADGYLARVDPDAVDLHRFRRLLTRARSAGPDRGELLEQALALWRGEAFGGLDTPWLSGVRAGLDADRLAAELDLTDLALARGRHREVLGDLAARAAAHPYDERIAGQLMTALYRSGRQAEALRRYQDIRSRLAEELGTDPTAALQRCHRQILAGAAAPPLPAPSPLAPSPPAALPVATPPAAATAPAATAPAAAPAAAPGLAAPGLAAPASAAPGPAGRREDRRAEAGAPRQLPAPPSVFTGRVTELSLLDALREPAPDAAATAVVSGSAGVGKTTLALHWAHRVAGHFPDGQLYVNLRGFDQDGATVGPEEAVRGFLDALGVPARRVPIGLAAQTALYRSLVAGRRLLVILDNARDAAQVRQLLPGGAGCATVVTSRDQLAGLVALDAARPVTLDLFTPADARAFLTRRLGAERVAGEPAAVDEIVARCARLPLALAVVAARAAAHRGFRIAELAAELRAAGGSLDPFDGGEPAADVRAVFSWSYDALGPGAARLFRLAGLHPGAELSVPVAAVLTDLPPAAARRLLTELVRAHLVTERSPGRYTGHDLLRAYAAERAGAEEPAAELRAVRLRLLDHYLHTAYAADRLLYPHRDPIVPAEPVPGAAPGQLADRAAATAWFRAEHRNLLALIDGAARAGFDGHAWQLAWSVTSYFNLSGHWHDQVTAQEAALAAARRLGDAAAQAHLHRNLGRACTQLGRLDRAGRELARALELFGAAGDRANQAQTHVNIARVREQQGRDLDALHEDRRSLELYRAARHLTGQARALNNIACMLSRLGEHDEARALCRQALEINESIGNRHGAATNWQSLGVVEHAAGAYREAITACRRALELFGEVGDRGGAAETWVCLGEARQASGAADGAVAAWERALPLLDEMGHPDTERVRRYLADRFEPATR